MPDNATYIKLLSSQRAAGVFMRYFTLYGARGGHTNPAPLPFRVAKAEPCTQTAGIETLPEARKVTRRRRARGKESKRKTPQPCHRCPGLRENRKLFQLIGGPGFKSIHHLIAFIQEGDIIHCFILISTGVEDYIRFCCFYSLNNLVKV